MTYEYDYLVVGSGIAGMSFALKVAVETDPASIVPQTTKKEFEGNLTVVVFPWVKAARKAPEAVGKEIPSPHLRQASIDLHMCMPRSLTILVFTTRLPHALSICDRL